MEGTLHAVVPDAMPLPPLLFDQLTDVTPTLSAAVPAERRRSNVDDVTRTCPSSASQSRSIGASGIGGRVPVVTRPRERQRRLDCSTPSDTLAVTEYAPGRRRRPRDEPGGRTDEEPRRKTRGGVGDRHAVGIVPSQLQRHRLTDRGRPVTGARQRGELVAVSAHLAGLRPFTRSRCTRRRRSSTAAPRRPSSLCTTWCYRRQRETSRRKRRSQSPSRRSDPTTG